MTASTASCHGSTPASPSIDVERVDRLRRGTLWVDAHIVSVAWPSRSTDWAFCVVILAEDGDWAIGEYIEMDDSPDDVYERIHTYGPAAATMRRRQRRLPRCTDDHSYPHLPSPEEWPNPAPALPPPAPTSPAPRPASSPSVAGPCVWVASVNFVGREIIKPRKSSTMLWCMRASGISLVQGSDKPLVTTYKNISGAT